jgi:hypothetical protein
VYSRSGPRKSLAARTSTLAVAGAVSNVTATPVADSTKELQTALTNPGYRVVDYAPTSTDCAGCVQTLTATYGDSLNLGWLTDANGYRGACQDFDSRADPVVTQSRCKPAVGAVGRRLAVRPAPGQWTDRGRARGDRTAHPDRRHRHQPGRDHRR